MAQNPSQAYSHTHGDEEDGVHIVTIPGALGSAMFAAVAAGKAAGGHQSIFEAAQAMAHLQNVTYKPIPAHKAVYDQLYAKYVKLHDYFGRGVNDVMKRLKSLRQQVLTNSR